MVEPPGSGKKVKVYLPDIKVARGSGGGGGGAEQGIVGLDKIP